MYRLGARNHRHHKHQQHHNNNTKLLTYIQSQQQSDLHCNTVLVYSYIQSCQYLIYRSVHGRTNNALNLLRTTVWGMSYKYDTTVINSYCHNYDNRIYVQTYLLVGQIHRETVTCYLFSWKVVLWCEHSF